MSEIQLERLRQDSLELQEYAQKLERKGKINLMQKILAKRKFLENRIKEAS
jgi:phage shock protein A